MSARPSGSSAMGSPTWASTPTARSSPTCPHSVPRGSRQLHREGGRRPRHRLGHRPPDQPGHRIAARRWHPRRGQAIPSVPAVRTRGPRHHPSGPTDHQRHPHCVGSAVGVDDGATLRQPCRPDPPRCDCDQRPGRPMTDWPWVSDAGGSGWIVARRATESLLFESCSRRSLGRRPGRWSRSPDRFASDRYSPRPVRFPSPGPGLAALLAKGRDRGRGRGRHAVRSFVHAGGRAPPSDRR